MKVYKVTKKGYMGNNGVNSHKTYKEYICPHAFVSLISRPQDIQLFIKDIDMVFIVKISKKVGHKKSFL